MKTKKHNKEKLARPPMEQGTLTGTALVSVGIFLQEVHAFTSTGSAYTIDSNEETTRQILDRHMNTFSEAWEALADR